MKSLASVCRRHAAHSKAEHAQHCERGGTHLVRDGKPELTAAFAPAGKRRPSRSEVLLSSSLRERSFSVFSASIAGQRQRKSSNTSTLSLIGTRLLLPDSESESFAQWSCPSRFAPAGPCRRCAPVQLDPVPAGRGHMRNASARDAHPSTQFSATTSGLDITSEMGLKKSSQGRV